jgi:arachidonate 15-lipoxygenase
MKAALIARLVQNNLLSDLHDQYTSPDGGILNYIHDRQTALKHKVLKKIWGPPRDVQILPYNCRTPLSLPDYENILQSITPPISIHHWHEDWYFAWQRLTGVNPDLLTRVRAHDNTFFQQLPITNTQFQQAIGNSDDSLDAAIAEGRLFFNNFELLDKIPTGVTSDSWRKYLFAPIGLFYVNRQRTSGLLPVAIQCHQKPGADNPIFTPASDRYAWLMAKTAFQVADSNYQGMVPHGAYCHIMMGTVAICTYRTLAPNHPIRVLLHPHFEFTIPIDAATNQIVIAPGGNTPTLQSVSLQGAIEVTQRALAQFDWTEQSAMTALKLRGTRSPHILPEYPYRDDIVLSWQAIYRFVTRYIRLYYTSNADVVGDREVQNWLRELGAPEGGNIRGMGNQGTVSTVRELITLVAQIMLRATSYHAAVNYSVFPAMGYAVNMPGAAFSPFPLYETDSTGRKIPKTQYSQADFLELLPTRALAVGQLADVYVVSNVIANHMGQYECSYFVDRRVRPLVEEFQSALRQIEFEIQEHNKDRRLPYEILIPSQVPASVHI